MNNDLDQESRSEDMQTKLDGAIYVDFWHFEYWLLHTLKLALPSNV